MIVSIGMKLTVRLPKSYHGNSQHFTLADAADMSYFRPFSDKGRANESDKVAAPRGVETLLEGPIFERKHRPFLLVDKKRCEPDDRCQKDGDNPVFDHVAGHQIPCYGRECNQNGQYERCDCKMVMIPLSGMPQLHCQIDNG